MKKSNKFVKIATRRVDQYNTYTIGFQGSKYVLKVHSPIRFLCGPSLSFESFMKAEFFALKLFGKERHQVVTI